MCDHHFVFECVRQSVLLLHRAATKNYSIGVTDSEILPGSDTWRSDAMALNAKNYLHDVCEISEIHTKLKNGGTLDLGRKYNMKIKVVLHILSVRHLHCCMIIKCALFDCCWR